MKFVRSLLADDSGQTSIEYILMLVIGAAMALSVIKKFLQPIFAQLADSISNQLQSTLFNKANMHSLRIGH